MKKISLLLVLVLTAVFGVTVFASCGGANETLKIYNWSEYMYEGIDDDFADYYKKETGKKINVEIDYFTTNEDMYTIIEDGADYDLLCPSDYMIEKLISKNMLEKIDKSIFNVNSNVYYPRVKEMAQLVDPNFEYLVPYLWGTLGIMYNVNEAEIDIEDCSWTELWDANYGAKSIYMKESIRDTYAAASIYANIQSLSDASDSFEDYSAKSYQDELFRVMNTIDATSIALAQTQLETQKPLVLKYDDDNGKVNMINGTGGKLGLFWSCDAGYAMSENEDLRYVIPKEGSNIYFDAFVISKNAKNKTAANYFLKFLCDKETAVSNMEESGSTSAITAAMNEYRLTIEEDDSLDEDFRANLIYTMFTPTEVLERCVIFKDISDSTLQMLTDMFSTVRS